MIEIPRSAWRTQPWKNGGGTTHEIVRWPADTVDDGTANDAYEIRISLAEVRAGGPFSTFPGYHRWSFLVGAAPITLTSTGSTGASVLEALGDHVAVAGDAPLTALADGPTQLVNVLARTPIAVGFGPTPQPVSFVFVVVARTDLPRWAALANAQPMTFDTTGCIWIARLDPAP